MLAFDACLMIHMDDDAPKPSYYNEETEHYDYRKYMLERRDEYLNSSAEKPEAGSIGDKKLKINKKAIEEYERGELKSEFINLTPKYKSSHVILLVSGWLSEDDNHSESWLSVIKAGYKPSIFSYNWSACKNLEGGNILTKSMDFIKKSLAWSEIKYKAEDSGKLLAYALMSDFLFENQTVSLMGFSLGTQVIVR